MAVEPDARITAEAAAPQGKAERPRAAGPFLYPSGSRPLEGYTIKRGVGEGGFGEIYYATSDAGKEVALKLIRRNLDVELRGIRQCLNLKHPNLLDLYDIRQDEHGDTWVVMEYISGRCLEDVLADHPDGLPPDEVLAWIHGIGAGVAYLHDRGIVHRDLKPGNVFCDEGVVKIGDYGLSKFISCSRRSGHTESIGTVHYMAPEVANGRYGKEIDVYALGVMLYEMLTGRVPFDGESVGEVLMKHLTAQPDVSMLGEPYRSVVARALEKDPARRFPTAGEMLAGLPPAAGSVAVRWPARGGAIGASASPPRSEGTRKATASFHEPPPQPVEAEVVPEEPIWRFVRGHYRKLRADWDQSKLNLPLKIAFGVLLIVALVASASVSIPLAIVLAIVYGVYWIVWTVASVWIAPQRNAARPPAAGVDPMPARVVAPPPPAAATAPRMPSHVPAAWESRAAALPVLGPRARLTQLVGSLLAGAMAAMATCVVVILIYSYCSEASKPQQSAWLALMGIAGTWAVLVPAKFWEGTVGEPALRRFTLMIIGLSLGLAAWLAADVLLVDLPHGKGILNTGFQLPQSFYADGRPLPMAFMAVFGTLMVLQRWWLQADPLRRSRLSLRAILLSCILALVVAAVWHFPEPWLVMVAAVMSVSVQLASPWVPPHQRLRPQRKTII